MILREIKHLYEKYKKTGKITVIQNQDLGQESTEAYMIAIPDEVFKNKNFDPSHFIRHPMWRLHDLWSKTHSILGSIIHLSFPIFLITLNKTFKQKFDVMLNDIIFKELKKYQYKSKIGGVGCLDLLYNGPVDDIKYFIIFDKQWDMIKIDVYSTLMIDDITPKTGKNIMEIIYDLVYTGYFLEEKQNEYCNFYKKLFETNFFCFYISRFHVGNYRPFDWWDPLSDVYENYLKDIYNLKPETIRDYQILVANNKFCFRWAIIFNYRLHKMSLYKNESLEEVREIFCELGITSRVDMNDLLLNGEKSTNILGDWMLFNGFGEKI